MAIGYGLFFSLLGLVGAYIYYLETRPDLKVWHKAKLDQEFRADRTEATPDLDAYLKLEDTLFQELEQEVYARIEDADRREINRYHAGSLMDPDAAPTNWNRTFELAVDQPVAGALMLHGLSDSPYSMRALAQVLHQHGVWVVGLRTPGHGTAPAGLLDVSWQDFAAAVRLAARHVKTRIGSQQPFYMVGYSNGAALAVDYALSVMNGADLPVADKLVLLSPAIGVSPAAVLALWQERLSKLAGLKKLGWKSIQPEFDPYKYNSFTINAADQIYELTQSIAAGMQQHASTEGVKGFPKVIAFQSVVDATIPPATLIDVLFEELAAEGHELVLFDINRRSESEPLLRSDPESLTERLLADVDLTFTVTLVTNLNPATDEVVALTKPAGSDTVIDEPLGMIWPPGIFSLSHVALPFPPDDPLYGIADTVENSKQHITLGNVVIRGERNLLQIPDDFFLRLRHNPFFPYLAERMLRFLEIEPRLSN